MANERKTVVTYKGDGSQKAFTFPFDYLRKSFVKAMLDGVEQTYGLDYTVNNKQLDFSVAPANGVVIVIYRETSTDRLVAWEDASVLRASDMTLFEVQLLHIAEETQDKVQDAGMARDDYDNIWDARFTRIKNVSDPVDALDVVNKQYFQSTQAGYIQASQALVNEATNQKNQATTQAQNAATSAAKALVSENNAKASENTAKTSETNAKTYETNAANSASTASSKATESTNQANRSKTEADRAYTEANRSRDEANRAYGEAERAKSLTDGVIVPAPSIPVGIPFPWFSNTFPDGTLECNGQSFSTTQYPELARVYPNGVLPDLRGVVLRGLDRGRGLDSEPSRTVGSYQEDAIRNISGRIHLSAEFCDLVEGAFTMKNYGRRNEGSASYGKLITFDASRVVPTATENRVKNVACYWLVYATNVAYDTSITGANALTLGGYPASHFLSGADQVGSVVQVVQSVLADPVVMATAGAWVSIFSATITPKFSTSKILVMAHVGIGSNGINNFDSAFGLFRNDTQIALPNSYGSMTPSFLPFGDRNQSEHEMTTVSNAYLDSPASSSALTYALKAFNVQGHAHYINRTGADSGSNYDNRMISTLTLMEVKA